MRVHFAGDRAAPWAAADARWSPLVLAGAAPARPALAEPYEDQPDAAARDPDYAAGKVAVERKNWKEAVKRFTRPRCAIPRTRISRTISGTRTAIWTVRAGLQALQAGACAESRVTAAPTSTSAKRISSWTTSPAPRSTWALRRHLPAPVRGARRSGARGHGVSDDRDVTRARVPCPRPRGGPARNAGDRSAGGRGGRQARGQPLHPV